MSVIFLLLFWHFFDFSIEKSQILQRIYTKLRYQSIFYF